MQVNLVTPRIYILMENVSLVGIDLRSICSDLPLQQTAGLTLAVFILLFNEKLATERTETHTRDGVWMVFSSRTYPLTFVAHSTSHWLFPSFIFLVMMWTQPDPEFSSVTFIVDLEKAAYLKNAKQLVQSTRRSQHVYLHTLSQQAFSTKTLMKVTINCNRPSFSAINPK